MNTLSHTVLIHKKSIDLTPETLFVFRQCKVIEAIGRDSAKYYLFFYKDTFLHAAQLDQVPAPSFLSRTIADGITFPGSHPLTSALLNLNRPLHSMKFSLLFKKAKEKYGPLDTVMLLTFLDACLPIETVHKQFKNTFYYYRRNGQLLAAYKTLCLYRDFDPKDTFATDMLNNMDFHRYQKRYEGIHSMNAKDGVFLEFLCFENFSQPGCAEKLIEVYQKENRWIDELAIHSSLLLAEKKSDRLPAIQSLITEKLTDEQQTLFLQYLLSSLPSLTSLRTYVLDRLIKQKNHREIIQFILESSVEIDTSRLPSITKSFLEIHPSELLPFRENLNTTLLILYQDDPQTLEKLARRCVIGMLESCELSYIKNWLSVFSSAGIQLPITNKLNNMEMYQEDPDQQFALGELYLDFQQYQKSIDCFKWEMELNPDDPKPIQYLSKVYLTLGEKEEAKAYTMLLHQMGKKKA